VYLPLALREECLVGFQHTDVALVIDASTSMRDQVTSSGRRKLDAAREAVALFVGQLDLAGGDQAAIVQFNADAVILAPLSTDRAVLNRGLVSIHVAQQTRIQTGVRLAREELASDRHRRVNNRAMVVLTDGANNPEPVSEAEREATLARGDGIRVFTVGLGKEVEGAALARMATSAADYFYAPDGEDLAAIYRRIAYAIPCPPEQFWGKR
jgi:Ca-activated chloride channel homolog